MSDDRTLTPEELAAQSGGSGDTWSPDAPATAPPVDVPTAIRATGRYRPLDRIGQGGMGAVWRVEDTALGRVVALKLIRPDRLRHHTALEPRFREEAQVTAQLQHPAIVPVYDIGRLPTGALFYTMQEVAGQTFDRVVDSVHAASSGVPWHADARGWTWVRLVEVVRTVAEAVGLAHARGVLHRDLKPQNILVGDRGQVFVLDWGLAKVLGGSSDDLPVGSDPVRSNRSESDALQTTAGQVAGTYGYMAPEQAAGEVDRLGPASDVYALGAVLFRVMTGEEPRADAEAMDAVLARARAAGRVPEGLDRIVRAALAPERDDRPVDGRALAAALTAWLDGARERERTQILVEQAESALGALPPRDRAAADAVLGRLLDADGRPARRRQDDVAETEAAQAVVDALRDAGAVLRSPGGELTIAEAGLLRSWPRLQALALDTAGRRHAARISEAARGWADDGRSRHGLATGAELEALAAWARAHPSSLTAVERDWVAACRTAAAEAARTRRARLRGLAVVAGLAAVAMGLLWWRAERARAEAEGARAEAEAAGVRAHGERLLALGHAEAASDEQWSALALYRAADDVLGGHPRARAEIREVPATEMAVMRLEPASGIVFNATFSQDGRWLASSTSAGTVRIVDVETGSLAAQLEAGTFAGLRWLDTGQLSVLAEDLRGYRIDPETGAVDGPFAGDGAAIIDIHPRTGRVLLAHGATLGWDDGGRRVDTEGHPAIGWFDRTGARVATLAMNAPMELRRTTDLSLIRRLKPPHPVKALTMVGPDAVIAYTQRGSAVPRAHLLTDDLADWLPLQPVLGHGCSWTSAAYSTDGGRMACTDGTTLTVLHRTGSTVTRAWRTEFGASERVKETRFSHDGRLLAVGTGSGSVLLHDAETGARIWTGARGGDTVRALGFSPDDRLLAVGREDGTVELGPVPTHRYQGAVRCDGAPCARVDHVVTGADAWAFWDGRTVCRAPTSDPSDGRSWPGQYLDVAAAPGSDVLGAITRDHRPVLLHPDHRVTDLPRPTDYRLSHIEADPEARDTVPWLFSKSEVPLAIRVEPDGSARASRDWGTGGMLLFSEARRLVNVPNLMGSRTPTLVDLDTLEQLAALPFDVPQAGNASFLAADPGRNQVLAVDRLGAVRAYDLVDGTPVGAAFGDPLPGALRLLTDGPASRVVALTPSGVVRAWRRDAPEAAAWTLTLPHNVQQASVLADVDALLIRTPVDVRLHDLDTGHLRLRLPAAVDTTAATAGSITSTGTGALAQVGLWDVTLSPDDPVDAAGARTNLRVCRDTLAVVPVLPFPPADSVWAPPDACETD